MHLLSKLRFIQSKYEVSIYKRASIKIQCLSVCTKIFLGRITCSTMLISLQNLANMYANISAHR